MAIRRRRTVDLTSAGFYDVAGTCLHSGQTGPGWSLEPAVGGDPRVLVELAHVLRRHTADPGHVALAVWAGFSGLPQIAGGFTVRKRRYHGISGPIGCLVDPVGRGYPANLAWSVDDDWIAVSDIDLPSTYVAGPSPLIESILACRALEAVEVTPDASVSEPLP